MFNPSPAIIIVIPVKTGEQKLLGGGLEEISKSF